MAQAMTDQVVHKFPKHMQNFFCGKGYDIDSSNILESINLSDLDPDDFELMTINE